MRAVIAATDETGASLIPPKGDENMRGVHRTMYYNPGYRGHNAYGNLNLVRGDKSATMMKVLKGKIGQVIHYSPQERRVLFEEAAGITRFLQRKAEALRRLEQTDQNLQRAEDIQREVGRQITILERQAEEAITFQERSGAAAWSEWRGKR